eukprot:GEMP01042789.1.p1 GENE.GEMP01042789.1~~GEMP01042789.1.p1  ORF type:complete len:357 (+),score=77.97 GEMP01042789.1:212-1282(+)
MQVFDIDAPSSRNRCYVRVLIVSTWWCGFGLFVFCVLFPPPSMVAVGEPSANKNTLVRIVLPGAWEPYTWVYHPCNGVTCKWLGNFANGAVSHFVTALDLPASKNRIPVFMEGAVANPRSIRRDANVAAIANYDFGVSDIFVTYFQLPSPQGARIAAARPVDFATAEKKILWLAGNCGSLNNRENMVRGLQKEEMLDSVGSCLHNKDVGREHGFRGGINKSALMTRYLFYAAFENQNATGYVTEKFWDALAAGTVPIVYGVPNRRDILPSKWAIWADEFASPEALAAYVRHVAHNKTLYMQFQNARLGPWPAWFVRRWTFPNNKECRICQWVAAKRYPHKFSFDVPSQVFSVNGDE